MEIKIEINDDSARIIPGKQIDLTNSGTLKEKFHDLIKRDFYNIILDLKNVEEIDSSALGKILLFNKIISEKEGSFKIENVNSEYVQNVLDMIELDQLIDISD